jgi:hypothetical protein
VTAQTDGITSLRTTRGAYPVLAWLGTTAELPAVAGIDATHLGRPMTRKAQP